MMQEAIEWIVKEVAGRARAARTELINAEAEVHRTTIAYQQTAGQQADDRNEAFRAVSAAKTRAYKALSRLAVGLARLAEIGEEELANEIRDGVLDEVIHGNARAARREIRPSVN